MEMDWLKQDEIKTRVSYVEGKEDYETLAVNDVVTTKDFSELGRDHQHWRVRNDS